MATITTTTTCWGLVVTFIVTTWLVGLASSEPIDYFLIQKIMEEQSTSNVSLLPFAEIQVAGLFRTNAHVNFVGGELEYLLRAIGVYDVEFMSTATILQVLLETEAFLVSEGSSKLKEYTLPEGNITAAIEALMVTFSDRNYPVGASIFVNWPQRMVDGRWMTYSPDLSAFLNESVAVEKELLGLLRSNLPPSINDSIVVEDVDVLIKLTGEAEAALRVPSDFSSTLMNLAVGALLSNSPRYAESFEMWQKYNPSNFSQVIEAIQLHSYSPFMKGNGSNTIIDPRSYYVLQPFLSQLQTDCEAKGAQPSLSLIPLWIASVNMTGSSKDAPYGPSMPENVNSIDMSVTAYSLYSLASAALSLSLEGSSMEGLSTTVASSAAVIEWLVENNAVIARPDLALTTHPSVYSFYWIVSRFTTLISLAPTAPSIFQDASSQILEAMQNVGTSTLLSLSKVDGGYVYWEEFIGLDDKNIFGGPMERPQDRVYSTALVAITLMNTWGHRPASRSSSECVLAWLPNTPVDVFDAVDGAVLYLNGYALDEDALENPSLSTSIKSSSSVPYSFPANFLTYLNGTLVNQFEKNVDFDQLVDGVSGVLTEAEYNLLLEQTWFGERVPEMFESFNAAPFPYFSSTPLTYALVQQALVKYDAILSGCQ